MLRTILATFLLGTLVLPAVGCMTCCNPCCGPVMPGDGCYPGCVETGPLGCPRSGRCQAKRAMQGNCGVAACQSCGGTDYGVSTYDGMQTGMVSGGSCPTCQQQMPMNSSSMGSPMMNPQYSDSMHMQPMNMPTPMPSEPTLSIPTPNPAPTPTPGPAANATSYYYPQNGGQYYSPPPQVQPFNTYNPAPVQQTLYAP